jgi:hypothetical protein
MTAAGESMCPFISPFRLSSAMLHLSLAARIITGLGSHPHGSVCPDGLKNLCFLNTLFEANHCHPIQTLIEWIEKPLLFEYGF